MIMEDVEIQDNHYGQGGLYYRIGHQILLQFLYQRTTNIYRPSDYPGGTQGFRIAAEPQIPHIEGLLAHCGPREGTNARGRQELWRPSKRVQEANAKFPSKGYFYFRVNLDTGRLEDCPES